MPDEQWLFCLIIVPAGWHLATSTLASYLAVARLLAKVNKEQCTGTTEHQTSLVKDQQPKGIKMNYLIWEKAIQKGTKLS
jgi:hypothetical protein